MLWIILGAIIGVIFGLWMALDTWGADFFEYVMFPFMLGLFGVALGLLIGIMSGFIAECRDAGAYKTVEDTNIYALQDNLTTEGSFFLGSGNIEGELKYFYVKETEFGYTVCNVDADESYIQYTSDRCHVEKQTYTFDNAFVRAITIPLSERYIFYIPNGSIITNYTIDLE